MNSHSIFGFSAPLQQKDWAFHTKRAGRSGLKITMRTAAFLFLIGGILASAGADYSARINGAADFLSNRSNENDLYLFSRAMKHNPYTRHCLPNVFSMVKSSGLRPLLMSDSMDWKKSVENDLIHLQVLLLNQLQRNPDTTLFEVYSSLTDSLAAVFDGVKVRGENDTCSCDIVYPAGKCTCVSQATKELTSSVRLSIMGHFRNSFQYTTIAELSLALKEFHLGDFTVSKKVSTFSKALKEIRTERFITIGDSIEKWRSFLTGDTSGFYLLNMLAAFYCRLDSALDCAVKMTDSGETFQSRIDNTFQVVNFVNQLFGECIDFSSGDFTDFQRHVLFLAKIADAKSDQEVRTCLNTVLLPKQNFQIKRHYQGVSASVSAYLGFAAGMESGGGTYKRNWSGKTVKRFMYGGLTTPVGIELSKGWASGWSSGLFFPIVDIGPAVNTILFSRAGADSKKMEFTDLFVPGVCLTTGIKEYPVAIGAGWYKGKSIRKGTPGEHHLYCFVALDAPLLCWRF
jgi:hypothetical protein